MIACERASSQRNNNTFKDPSPPELWCSQKTVAEQFTTSITRVNLLTFRFVDHQ